MHKRRWKDDRNQSVLGHHKTLPSESTTGLVEIHRNWINKHRPYIGVIRVLCIYLKNVHFVFLWDFSQLEWFFSDCFVWDIFLMGCHIKLWHKGLWLVWLYLARPWLVNISVCPALFWEGETEERLIWGRDNVREGTRSGKWNWYQDVTYKRRIKVKKINITKKLLLYTVLLFS